MAPNPGPKRGFPSFGDLQLWQKGLIAGIGGVTLLVAKVVGLFDKLPAIVELLDAIDRHPRVMSWLWLLLFFVAAVHVLLRFFSGQAGQLWCSGRRNGRHYLISEIALVALLGIPPCMLAFDDPSITLKAMAALIGILVSMAYYALEMIIVGTLVTAPVPAVSTLVKAAHPFGDHLTVAQIAAHGRARATEPAFKLARWLADGSGEAVVAGATVLVVLGLFISSLALAAAEGFKSQSAEAPATIAQPPTTTTSAAPPTTAPTTTASSTASTTARELRFEDVCGQGAIQPGDRAPSWAVAGFQALYFEKNRGAGAGVAGCPTPSQHIADSSDEVYYQANYFGQQLISVSIVSRAFGAVLFLGPPATAVLELLNEGTSVFGSARVNVGNGDVQLAYTQAGTIAFIRPEKVHKLASGSTEPGKYTTLPPVATELWLYAMQQHGSWLWPLREENNVSFAAQPWEPPVHTIELLGDTRASRRLPNAPSYQATGVRIAIDELTRTR